LKLEETKLRSTACWNEFAVVAANMDVLSDLVLMGRAKAIVLAAPAPHHSDLLVAIHYLGFSLSMICNIASAIGSRVDAWEYTLAMLHMLRVRI
jgi:hypothetical protein